MRRAVVCSLLLAVMMGPLVPAARAEDEAEQVRQAIRMAVRYLKSKQTSRGGWNELPHTPGGVSALCTLALLNAGESPDSESMRRALAHLGNLRPEKTYTVALQTMAFAAADPKLYKHKITGNARWLVQQQIKVGNDRGARKGGWTYPFTQSLGSDPSNSQFALLALHEAERAGVVIDAKTWEDALDYWLSDHIHSSNGGWRYRSERPDSASMTCAGIASVVIAAGKLSPLDAEVAGDRVIPCRRQPDTKETTAINKGLEWLEKNYSVWTNPPLGQSYHYYYLYGLERVGRLTARRKIGENDWYRDGVEMLLRDVGRGRFQGSWTGARPHEDDPVIATALALLFLSKGRRPVLMSKLTHGPDEDWNHHRHDVANLTRYVEKRWQKDLTWQVIESKDAGVEDLLTTPVLFISGRDGLKVAREMDLRKYVDAGGFIFAERCGGGAKFDEDFRKLMGELFPDSPLRKLPPDHPVYFAEEEVHPDHRPVLWGIDACCRTSVVYSPEDLSCYWEVAESRDLAKYHARVKAAVRGKLSTGINVLAYATGRQLKDKLDTPRAIAPQPDEQVERGKLQVIKLDHAGGSDAAPNALPNLLTAAGELLKMRIGTPRNLVPLGDKQLFRHHVAFMHGRHRFRLTKDEREGLRRFVERGGFVLVDSICANPDFTESFRREMAEVFPKSPLEDVPRNHPLLTDQFGGTDITTVTRREPQFRRAGDALKANLRRVPPTLEGIVVGDRYGVIFSPYDISCALENHESLQCRGYTRADATKIGINAILYALHQ